MKSSETSIIDPRLLLIDMTPMAGSAATSTLKQAYFGDWRDDALLQIQAAGSGLVALSDGPEATRRIQPCVEKARGLIEAFRPQIIFYRPVADHPQLHAFAMNVLEVSDAPLAMWMMDDWPERMRESDPARFALMDDDLRALFARSKANFAISDGMAKEFGARYRVPFDVAHNGVIASDWPARSRRAGKEIIVRYAGSLAPDTTKESVFSVAKAVSALAAAGRPIKFEGVTQEYWHRQFSAPFNQLRAVSMRPATMPMKTYRQWLVDADINLIAYNFDDATRRYLQFSFANKTPEAFAAGAAILAYGPEDLETIAYLSACGAAEVVTEEGVQAVKTALSALVDNPQKRTELAATSRDLAFSKFNLDTQRDRMKNALRASAFHATAFDDEEMQPAKAQFDECRFVFEILNAEDTPGVMIDVGAHHGGSLKPFAHADWKVWAFEPDSKNRNSLEKSFGGDPNVMISPKAIGAQEARDVAFYTSAESSGISSLSAFHESHVEAAKVDVTTLSRLIENERLIAVDFLKIDVEGHEMDVLDGLDFSLLKPRAIVAEFEDAKTRDREITMRDLADRLRREGYTIYVSEWHPVERYGVTHSWRRLRLYPCDAAPNAWGNLIALLEIPTDEAFEAAFAAARRGGSAGLGARATIEAVAEPAPQRSAYRKAADWITTEHPRLARVLRFFARPVLSMVRRSR